MPTEQFTIKFSTSEKKAKLNTTAPVYRPESLQSPMSPHDTLVATAMTGSTFPSDGQNQT